MFTVVLIFDTPGLIDKMIKPFSLFYSFSSGNIFDLWNELLHGLHSVQDAEQQRIARNALDAESGPVGHTGVQLSLTQ